MDRFNSNEESVWDEAAFFDGGLAWTRKQPISVNPYPNGTWHSKSWIAGWADADQNWISEQDNNHILRRYPVISKEQIENDLEEVCECGDAKDSHVGGTGECNICRWNNPIPDSLPCKEFRPVSQS